MRVLVLEPHASGHHGPYLQWMMQGFAERGSVQAVSQPVCWHLFRALIPSGFCRLGSGNRLCHAAG
jgi:hypothetical protein